MSEVLKQALEFKKKYPTTIAWRIKAHAKVVEKHLNPGETVIYTFLGQKNDRFYDIISTNIIVITNKRLIVATKRDVYGYFLTAITPDLFNDVDIKCGIIWGKVYIDTIDEFVTMSNIDKKALIEVETQITENIIREKKKYKERVR